MEIVTTDAAPVLPPDVVAETLLEMAAVIRTIFGVGLPSGTDQPGPEPVGSPVAAPALAPAPLAVPAAPTPLALPAVPAPPPAVRAQAPKAIAVPTLPVPQLGSVSAVHDPVHDPVDDEGREAGIDRHSLALLQEIAFLDD